ncbi:MAG: hypothetical protein ACJ8JD_13130 [Chthoniobacterales bacterium]
MTFSRINLTAIAALCLGALGTISVFIHAAGFSRLFGPYILWAVTPYAVLGGACFFADNRATSIAILVAITLADIFALLVYRDVLFIHSGSMSGLVFLFVPFYQLAGAIILLVVLVALRFARRRNRIPSLANDRKR